MFNPHEPRDKAGRWVRVIRASDLSTPDARRSPEVTRDEFQTYAERGRAKYDALKAGASTPSALQGDNWTRLKERAWQESREPWGGITTDAHTGKDVEPEADAYALTVREPDMPSVHVSPDADRAEFDKAMETAKRRYAQILSRPNHHLGVFHDQDTGNIDIDPVLVTPSLDDVHEIGAYTHAVGGAYHFKSGDGFWPPHVRDEDMALSIQTPRTEGEYDLARGADGKLAFWKQILPKKTIHYTAKDGTRGVLNFDEKYLTDLATNMAVDKVPFMLADESNRHTMDPERYRGDVVQLAVREDGLYGKIVFPNEEAARAVLMNPDLPVSARIRENVQRSDGSTVPRGIIHVLGTLDPQVSGMSGWQTTDLSTTESGDLLDLSNETFDKEKDMAFELTKPVEEYTDAEIDAFDEEELDAFLTAIGVEIDGMLDSDEGEQKPVEDKTKEREPEMALSNEMRGEIDLANARANKALRDLAEAKWEKARSEYLSEGVPPHMLDLAAPVLNRPDDMVIDLSVTDDEDVNVTTIVRGLLDAAKGTIDLSAEQGHGGTFRSGDGEDPDKALLDLWNEQFSA